MFHRKKRGRKRTDSSRRKDRLIQTRVGKHLERAIKAEAESQRVTVSHLLRNVLEECFNLVDDVVDDVDTIVSDSLGLAREVRLGAKRIRHAHTYNRFNEQPIDSDAEKSEDDVEAENHPEVDDTREIFETAPDRSEIGKSSLTHIYAWNKVVLSQSAFCSICGFPIQKGEDGYVGLCDEPKRDRCWLCESCIDKI